MGIDMQQFHQTFFEESFEGLDIMENELLNLDIGNTDSEVINTIFRAAHSIKGGSGTFGFTAVSEFTHVAETLLDEMRDGKRPVTQDAVDLLLKSVDVIRGMLTALQNEGDMDADTIAATQQELEKMLGAESPAASNNVSDSDTGAGNSGWIINFRPHSEMLRTGNDPVRMLHALCELGSCDVTVDLSELPSLDDLNPEDSFLAWRIRLEGDASESDVREIFEWVEDECDLEVIPATASMPEEESAIDAAPHVEQVAAPTAPQQPAANATVSDSVKAASSPAAKAAAKKSSESASIRVGIDKVDEIINLVGELVITQSMLGQIGSEIDSGDEYNGARMEKLLEGLAQLERNTREIQESVMRIRMLPISFVFSRVPRLIHDLSSKLGKKVELVITGEHTELDKTVMEKIGDPMVHLVRNALDHGIESPDKRVAKGKPETGTLRLNAYHKGGSIVIEISDDGAGLNKEKILAKARSNGLVGENENPSDDFINDLIFHPGFSTADQVSDVSGRGVGMDVVRKNIKALGGSVRVESNEGKGAVFTINLPLTLAILDGQLVRVNEETFIIPLVSIIESLQVKSSQVNAIAGRGELYKLRDEYIPIVRAHQVFGMPGADYPLDKRLMVVVEADGTKAGIIVDDLLAQQQVVIKSLETNYQSVDGLSGATILGDGTVALILDIPGVIDMFRRAENPMPPTPQKTDGRDMAEQAA